MTKRRKDHENCSNDDHKRTKILNEPSTPNSNVTDILVPDTPQSQIKKKVPANDIELSLVVQDQCEDGFSDEEDFNIDESLVKNIESTLYGFTNYARYVVSSIKNIGNTKVILCKDASSETLITLKLSGEWFLSNILPGSYIHVICGLNNANEVCFKKIKNFRKTNLYFMIPYYTI